MDKKSRSVAIVVVIALIFFSTIAVVTARTIETNTKGTCDGSVTSETQFFFERSTGYEKNILSNENVAYSETLKTKYGNTTFQRNFFAPTRGSLDVTTFTKYSASLGGAFGMERNEQAEVGRLIAVQQTPADKRRFLLCPFGAGQIVQAPTTLGEERAQGYNQQNVGACLITTRTMANVTQMEILHGMNATGQGSCSVGMGLKSKGEKVDTVDWSTRTTMDGKFNNFESVGFQRGSTREAQYNLVPQSP